MLQGWHVTDVQNVAVSNPLTKGCVYEDNYIYVLALAQAKLSYISLCPNGIPDEHFPL